MVSGEEVLIEAGYVYCFNALLEMSVPNMEDHENFHSDASSIFSLPNWN